MNIQMTKIEAQSLLESAIADKLDRGVNVQIDSDYNPERITEEKNEQIKDVLRNARDHNKIASIKMLREILSGLSLTTAKHIIDATLQHPYRLD